MVFEINLTAHVLFALSFTYSSHHATVLPRHSAAELAFTKPVCAFP